MHTPDFAPRFDTDLVKPYWDALERGELHLPACSECGSWQWYPFEFVKCHPDATHDWKAVSTEGTVFTFTEVGRNFLPNATADDDPYVSALVEPDGLTGIRIPTVLINLQGKTPAIGMRVRLAPLPRLGYTAPAYEPL